MNVRHIIECPNCDYEHVSFEDNFTIDDILDLIYNCHVCNIEICTECKKSCNECLEEFCTDCYDDKDTHKCNNKEND